MASCGERARVPAGGRSPSGTGGGTRYGAASRAGVTWACSRRCSRPWPAAGARPSQAVPPCLGPLPRAPPHLPPAPRRGAGVQARALRRDHDRLRPPRRRRAAPGARQAVHVPDHRPGAQVHPRRLPQCHHHRSPSDRSVRAATIDGAERGAHGATFLRQVVEVFPDKLHTVLTDNGMAFADLPKNRGRYPKVEAIFGGHSFDRVGHEHGIKHRHTKPYHPWTNGQAERMNRTVKDATIKAFHYPDLEALQAHVLAFVTACKFTKHLKALRWRTPFQAVRDAWQANPSIFTIDPHHRIRGAHT